MEDLESFEVRYNEAQQAESDLGQRVRLLSSDKILTIMKWHALTSILPVNTVWPRLAHIGLPLKSKEDAERDIKAELLKVNEALRDHTTHMWEYYHQLTDQMRADLGAAVELATMPEGEAGA